MKIGVKLFTIAIALTSFTPLWAATFTYEAVNDFTDINAGEVPYYRHNGVNALAINAAVEAYRDKFARATLAFEESAGTYDVTITALGEVDGDGEFRFLVDGVLVGSAINQPAAEDYGEQQHRFENITIPAGALLGVESVAVSNDTVPEGDGFAYARGRWTTLTIEEVETDVIDPVVVDPVTPDPVEPIDLSVTVDSTSTSVILGDEVAYTIEIENLSTFVATTPVAVVNLPQGLSNATSDVCAETGTGTLSCQLAEIAPGESTSFTVTALAATIGEKDVTVEVSGDQEDNITGNNSSQFTTIVENEAAPVDNTVDLQLTISADKEQLEVGETLTYTLSVTNQHVNNIATSPGIGITLPDSLEFLASDICTVSELIVQCNLEELPPAESTTVQFTASAVKVNSYSQLIATATSAQSENIVSNNEAQIVTDISTQTLLNIIPASNQPTESGGTTEAQTKSSGGGTFHVTALLLLISPLYLARRRRRYAMQ